MQISCMILSGGRATRMGGVDKGLVTLKQKPLIQHTIERIKPQVDEILINANRSLDEYTKFNLPVYQDEDADFIGPLAGFKLALTHAKHDLVLIVPCDSPLLPHNLATHLLATLTDKQADIVVASSDGHAHPVFCMCKKSVLPSLTQFLANDQRKVSIWQKSLAYAEADFSNPNSQGITESFLNLNTIEALNSVELLMTSTTTA